MADYYPLIARAVAGLEKNTGDARRALYERARGALVAQLRSVNPPLSENDVTRERLALEESIRKVEAEAARKTWVDPASGPSASPTRIRAPEFPRWDPPPSTPIEEDDPQNTARADSASGRKTKARSLRSRGAAASPASANGASAPSERYAGPEVEQPLSSEPEAPVPPRPPTPRPKQDRRSLLDAGLKDFREVVVSETDEFSDDLPRVVRPLRENGAAAPPPSSHEYDRIDARSFDSHDSPMANYSTPMLEQHGHDYDDMRSLPSRGGQGAAMERASRRSFGDMARIALTLLVLAGLGGVIVWQWPNMASLYRSARAPAPPPIEIAGDSQPTKTRSNKINDRLDQTGGVPTASPVTLSTGPTSAPSAAPGASVAQKVVLYEEDPNDPQGRRFVGSAIWRTERVSPGSGQPEDVAIRADVEIPDRKLTMTWSLRRNTDKSLPATHTVEIMFRLPQDFPAGSVTSVPGILMKQTEQTRGAPLVGHAVKVTDSYYLIGLSSIGADRETNLRMLKERGWFDIPVVYGNKRRAILAVEKGGPGERVFAEAFAAWRQ
jgi:hypothetical protein